MLSFKVKCAILILGELEAVKHDAPGLKANELKVKLGFPQGLQQVLQTMKNKGLLRHDAYRGWYSSTVNIEELSLWNLMKMVDDQESIYGTWPEISVEYPKAVALDDELADNFKRYTSDVRISDLVARRNG